MQSENRIIRGESFTALGPGRFAAAIGVFDGLHLGHRRLLDALFDLARRTGAEPVAVTFDPHPRSVLRAAHPSPLLLPPEKRCELLLEAGCKHVLVLHFTPRFAAQEPLEFLRTALTGAEMTGIAVGAGWRFGAQGRGDCALLTDYGGTHGIEVVPMPELELEGGIVSSSRIRQLIAVGRLEEAARLLGRPYRLYGLVEPGIRAAGPALGCPTANLRFQFGVLPPDGVYAARAFPPDGGCYAAAVNLGIAPTMPRAGLQRRFEAHLIDYQGNLYSREVAVEPLRYLRPERTFAGPAELARQIASDVEAIRAIVGETDGK